MSREQAGAAIRTLREARDWSLANFAEVTGVSIMGLSFLERGARRPHKGTVQKVENGLGLPPGTYARLLLADDPEAEIAELLTTPRPPTEAKDISIVVGRHTDTAVFEGFAEAQLAALRSVISRLPSPGANEYETYIRDTLAQCVKAELLAANSWRVAINAGADPDGPLLGHLTALEKLRNQLLGLLPDSLSSRLDAACARSGLPDHVVAAMLGVTPDQLWDMRNQSPIPSGVLARVQAFTSAL